MYFVLIQDTQYTIQYTLLSYFFLNNLHFFLEVLGAVVFIAVAWLAFDAYVLRKDFLTASRGVGFAFLAAWQIIHAFHFESDVYNYLGYVFYLAGLLFVLINLIREHPVERPVFQAVLVLPSLAGILSGINLLATAGLGLIGFTALHQYRKEYKKALIPFISGFCLLTLGSLVSVFYKTDPIGGLWLAGHIFEGLGFLAVGWWVWSYLQLRIREELLLILVSLTLLMAVVVGLTFSTILVSNVESSTKANLSASSKVLDLSLAGLKEEALAKVRLLTQSGQLASALAGNNFSELEMLSVEYMKNEKLGFLSVMDQGGNMIFRAHALTKKDDNLSGEAVVREALNGNSGVAFGRGVAEGFSVRAASPLVHQGKTVGVLMGGFQLDNAFVDSLKKLTGLDVSVFDGKTISATTILNPDRRSRSAGLVETNKEVLGTVLSDKKEITLSNNISSRPYLATYLPIVNNGEAVGMLSVAKAQSEILGTITRTNRLTFVVSAIILMILSIPLYFVTRRLTGEIK